MDSSQVLVNQAKSFIASIVIQVQLNYSANVVSKIEPLQFSQFRSLDFQFRSVQSKRLSV